MKTSLINADAQCEPLCRSYVCAVFDVLRIRILNEAGPQAARLIWAVGVLADHMPHYLGAWHVLDAKGTQWHAIVGDLYDRGIERLRIAIGPDPVEIQAAMAHRYRYTAILPAFATLEHSEIESSLSGHRQYIERALEVARPLLLRLKRAVARHGPFVDVAAAAAPLRRSADRFLYANWSERAEPPIRKPRTTAAWTGSAVGG